MKKWFCFFLSMGFYNFACALPVGNPAEASLFLDSVFLERSSCKNSCDSYAWCNGFSIRFGYYGDYVYNRHLERSPSADTGDIERFELTTNAGYLAFNFWEQFDLFATLGATKLFTDTNGPQQVEIESGTHFSWSAGARATLWTLGCTALGAEIQYFYTKPHITRFTIGAEESVYFPNNVNWKYREWQIGLGLSHYIGRLVPYIAIKWSNAHVNPDNASVDLPAIVGTIPDFESKKDWGYAVGVSLLGCNKMVLTVEGRFADEKALYVNGSIRF